MSGGPLRGIGRLLFWRYSRGSWQYDILCALILVFIFATPKSVFDGSYFRDRSKEDASSQSIERQAPSGESEEDPDDRSPANQ